MPTDLAVLEHEPAPADRVPEIALSEADLGTLRDAVAALERSTLAGRLSGMAGKPVELLGQALPAAARAVVAHATERALAAALKVALGTLPATDASRPAASERLNTALAVASGALGGALGLATLPLELPVSTTLILRAVADIARSEGEDLTDPAVALACLQVFALGSRAPADDLASSGYFAVRTVLARSVSGATRAAASGLLDASAPAFVRLLAQIAARFGVVVSQKVAAGAIPIVGALGGAAVNAAFMAHFRVVARAHFTVRRLERAYGPATVRAAYERIRDEPAG